MADGHELLKGDLGLVTTFGNYQSLPTLSSLDKPWNGPRRLCSSPVEVRGKGGSLRGHGSYFIMSNVRLEEDVKGSITQRLFRVITPRPLIMMSDSRLTASVPTICSHVTICITSSTCSKPSFSSLWPVWHRPHLYHQHKVRLVQDRPMVPIPRST
jgi:hypothetical protein